MILALDLGTKCGWAVGREGTRVASGCLNLKPRKHHPGDRPFALAQALSRLADEFGVTLIAMERFGGMNTMKSLAAALVYGELRGIALGFAESKNLRAISVHNMKLKKVTTGSGKASKGDMIAAVSERFSFTVEDDNEADALAVLGWAMDTEATRG